MTIFNVNELQNPYNLAVMNVGAPACGVNAAVRAFVRLGLTYGYGVVGIHDSYEGLVAGNVSAVSLQI